MPEEVTLEQHVILFTPPSGESSLIDPRPRCGFRFGETRERNFRCDNDNETSLSVLSDDGILGGTIGSFLWPIGTVDPSLGSRIFIGSAKRLGLAFIMRARVHEETAS